MALPKNLKISTSFYTHSVTHTGTWASYYIKGIEDSASGEPYLNTAVFIYKLREGVTGTSVDVFESADFVCVARPEYFNLTNTVTVKNSDDTGIHDSGCTWGELPEAIYTRLGEEGTEDYNKITGVTVNADECWADSHGFFRSAARAIWDLNAGITALKENTDESIKYLIANYRNCRAVTTSMDNQAFPYGYAEYTTGTESTALRVRLQSRVTAESISDSEIKYKLVVYVKDIINNAGGLVTNIPTNMFLYIKNNNADDKLEPVIESTYLRVVDPTDIQNLNPTTFGSEHLVWGRDDEVYSSADPISVLSPAISSSGGPVMGLDSGSTSPQITHTRTGYYKSRIYCFTTRSASETASHSYLIQSAVAAFCTKYIAQGKNVVTYDSYETEVLS